MTCAIVNSAIHGSSLARFGQALVQTIDYALPNAAAIFLALACAYTVHGIAEGIGQFIAPRTNRVCIILHKICHVLAVVSIFVIASLYGLEYVHAQPRCFFGL